MKNCRIKPQSDGDLIITIHIDAGNEGNNQTLLFFAREVR